MVKGHSADNANKGYYRVTILLVTVLSRGQEAAALWRSTNPLVSLLNYGEKCNGFLQQHRDWK